MPMLTVLLLTLAAVGPAAAPIEPRVHAAVRASMAANGGRALFSEIDNRGGLSADEREYAARLYEVFFTLPAQLAAEQRAAGQPPRLAEIAGNSGLTPAAVDLLLDIAVSDPRMPKLLTRVSEDGEIAALDLEALDRFVAQRGDNVKVAGWSGRALPAFALPALDGGTLASADLKGRPTLVFQWLTRCPVCRRITPDVVALARKLEPRGLRVVGLCADEALGLEVPPDERAAWLREQHVEYRNAVLDKPTRALLGNQNIFPGFLLVRRDGTIDRLILNPPDLPFLETAIEPLLDLAGVPDAKGGSR